jgi:hypothetical protein
MTNIVYVLTNAAMSDLVNISPPEHTISVPRTTRPGHFKSNFLAAKNSIDRFAF